MALDELMNAKIKAINTFHSFLMKISGHLNEQNLCREDVALTSDSQPVQFLRPPGCVAVNYVSCLQDLD